MPWTSEAIEAYRSAALASAATTRPTGILFRCRNAVEWYLVVVGITGFFSAIGLFVGAAMWLIWALIKLEGMPVPISGMGEWCGWASHVLWRYCPPMVGLWSLNHILLIGKHVHGPPRWKSYKIEQNGWIGWEPNREIESAVSEAQKRQAKIIVHQLQQCHLAIKSDCYGGHDEDFASILEIDGQPICVWEGEKKIVSPPSSTDSV